MLPLLVACMTSVATFYHLPPRVLPSIQMVEAGRVGMVSRNTNGSADLGVMQINTLWIGPLASHTGQTEAVVRRRLIDDSCYNVAVAGAILRIYLGQERGDMLRAIGNYHSHTPVLNRRYQARVLEAATHAYLRPR